jgi:hypothetical protein
MSPSRLFLSINLFAADGKEIFEKQIGDLTSPDNRFLSVNVNSIASDAKIKFDDISTFSVTVKSDKKIPTRVSHQLVYGVGSLNTSINISLHNPNVFVPTGKKSFKWGQAIIGSEDDSLVGIVADKCENPSIKIHDIKVAFFDETGKILEKNFHITNGGGIKLQLSKELKNCIKDLNEQKYIWLTAESENHGINFFSVSFNKNTMYCSGDHGF